MFIVTFVTVFYICKSLRMTPSPTLDYSNYSSIPCNTYQKGYLTPYEIVTYQLNINPNNIDDMNGTFTTCVDGTEFDTTLELIDEYNHLITKNGDNNGCDIQTTYAILNYDLTNYIKSNNITSENITLLIELTGFGDQKGYYKLVRYCYTPTKGKTKKKSNKVAIIVSVLCVLVVFFVCCLLWVNKAFYNKEATNVNVNMQNSDVALLKTENE
mmetsp:Transcript_64186/g.78491  ORF Transcript_64186/g.78491 Transcript_64186/m.78491 type:complete len:213 (-) Transcript_64186:126-764(-)